MGSKALPISGRWRSIDLPGEEMKGASEHVPRARDGSFFHANAPSINTDRVRSVIGPRLLDTISCDVRFTDSRSLFADSNIRKTASRMAFGDTQTALNPRYQPSGLRSRAVSRPTETTGVPAANASYIAADPSATTTEERVSHSRSEPVTKLKCGGRLPIRAVFRIFSGTAMGWALIFTSTSQSLPRARIAFRSNSTESARGNGRAIRTVPAAGIL